MSEFETVPLPSTSHSSSLVNQQRPASPVSLRSNTPELKRKASRSPSSRTKRVKHDPEHIKTEINSTAIANTSLPTPSETPSTSIAPTSLPASSPTPSSDKPTTTVSCPSIRPQPTNTPAPAPAPASRKPDARAEERSRSRRLFSGLISTLSGTSNVPPHISQKRTQVESRVQARKAQNDSPRTADLARRRQADQQGKNERAKRARHERMREEAGMLKTESRPLLFWRPWKMTRTQEETVRRQRQEVERLIEKEMGLDVSDHDDGRMRTEGIPENSESHKEMGRPDTNTNNLYHDEFRDVMERPNTGDSDKASKLDDPIQGRGGSETPDPDPHTEHIPDVGDITKPDVEQSKDSALPAAASKPAQDMQEDEPEDGDDDVIY